MYIESAHSVLYNQLAHLVLRNQIAHLVLHSQTRTLSATYSIRTLSAAQFKPAHLAPISWSYLFIPAHLVPRSTTQYISPLFFSFNTFIITYVHAYIYIYSFHSASLHRRYDHLN